MNNNENINDNINDNDIENNFIDANNNDGNEVFESAQNSEYESLDNQNELSVSMNEIINLQSESECNIKIQQCNVDKLDKNRANKLLKILENYDMVILTETNNPDDSTLNMFNEFEVFNSVKTGRNRGGITTIFNPEKINLGCRVSHMRHQVLKSNLQIENQQVQFFVCQFPLSTHIEETVDGVQVMEWENQQAVCDQIVGEIVHEGNIIIWVGDFNLKLHEIVRNRGGNEQARMMLNIIEEHELTMFDTEQRELLSDQTPSEGYPHTYQSANGNTRIDHIVSQDFAFDSIRVFYHRQNSFELISSHSALTLMVKTSNVIEEDIGEIMKLPKTIDSKKLDVRQQRTKFKEELGKFNLNEYDTLQELTGMIREAALESVPLDINNRFEIKSSEIRRLRKLKNYYKNHNMNTLYNRTVRRIRTQETIVKNKRFQNMVTSLNQKGEIQGRDFYNHVRTFLKKKQFIGSLTENIDGLRNINSTIEGIKNQWKNLQYKQYFSNDLYLFDGRIYTIIYKQFGKNLFKSFTQLVRENQTNGTQINRESLLLFMNRQNEEQNLNLNIPNVQAEIFLNEKEIIERQGCNQFVKEEIIKEFELINKHKAVGIDELDFHILNNLNINQFDQIAFLFSTYFKAGQFPQVAKINVMVNIPKKNNSNSQDNFRPISLNPTFMRTQQKLIKRGIFNEIDTFIDENQQGFMEKRSCIDAIYHFKQLWNKATENHQNVIFIWLDIAKAFNSLLDFELFEKLVDTNLNSEQLQALFNLQCNNNQVVRLGKKNQISDPFLLNLGIGQGQTISPKEFIFQEKELKSWIEEFNERLRRQDCAGLMYLWFADDTGLKLQQKRVPLTVIRRTIKDLISFLKNKFAYKNMKFNTGKFDFIASDKNITHLEIEDGLWIEGKRTFRLQGVHFDILANRSLKFNNNFQIQFEHTLKIIALCRNLNRANRLIKCQVMSNVCKAYLNGKIDYGSEVIHFDKAQFEKIEIRWRMFMKNLFGMKYTALNQSIQLISNSYRMEDRQCMRKINQQIKTKWYKNHQFKTFITEKFSNNSPQCDIFANTVISMIDFRGIELEGIIAENEQPDITDLNTIDQIDAIMNLVNPQKYHIMEVNFKKYLKTHFRLRYIVSIAFEINNNHRQSNKGLENIIRSICNHIETEGYLIKNMFSEFKITGINWQKYWDENDWYPRSKMNTTSRYQKAFSKIFTNNQRLGIWLKSQSRYIDEEGRENQSSNGNCNQCWAEEEVETLEHFINCPYQSLERQNLQNKLYEKFSDLEGFQLIEDLMISNQVNNIILMPSTYFRRRNLRFNKSQFEDQDLICKRFLQEIRYKRTKKMQETSLQDRFDVIEVGRYQEDVKNKFKAGQ